jgi:RHS repeat-associated protein
VGYTANNQISSGGWATAQGPFVSGTPSYDASGNMTNDLQNQYLYDAEGRVCAMQGPAISGIPGALVGYLYDAEGNRVGKGTLTSFSCNPDTNGFTLTAEYVLGQSGEQVSELDGAGNWVHTNAYAGGQLIATYDTASGGTYASPALHYQLADWLGTRRMQVSPAGAVEEACTSLPFGDQLTCGLTNATTADDATEHHFTGKERDSESGLDYFGARYLNSGLGRFLSPDWSAQAEPVPYAKLGDPQSLNLYSYVLNNPISSVDADGHDVNVAAAGFRSVFGDPAYDDINAINQNTVNGLLQYFAQNGHVPPPAQQQSQSSSTTTQTQSTDYVSVSYWPKGAGGFGHIGIGVDTDDTQGYSTKDPKTSIWKRIFGAPVGGTEDDIQAHTKNGEVAPHSYLHIPISADQAAAMRGAMDARTANGGHYNLIFNNCAQFVESVLHAGGVSGVPHAEVFGPAILGGILWAEH